MKILEAVVSFRILNEDGTLALRKEHLQICGGTVLTDDDEIIRRLRVFLDSIEEELDEANG